MEMGIKAGQPVQAVQWHVNFFGEHSQLIGGQIAELALNVPQFVENQGETSSPGRLFILGSENNHQSGAVLRKGTLTLERRWKRPWRYSCAKREE